MDIEYTNITVANETEKYRRQIQIGRLDNDLYPYVRAEAVRERIPVARVINRIIAKYYLLDANTKAA